MTEVLSSEEAVVGCDDVNGDESQHKRKREEDGQALTLMISCPQKMKLQGAAHHEHEDDDALLQTNVEGAAASEASHKRKREEEELEDHDSIIACEQKLDGVACARGGAHRVRGEDNGEGEQGYFRSATKLSAARKQDEEKGEVHDLASALLKLMVPESMADENDEARGGEKQHVHLRNPFDFLGFF